jgi:hypothetical protein
MRPRWSSALALAVLVLGAVVLVAGDAGAADSLQVKFEPKKYAPGPVHGQDGWSSAGAVGQGCAVYDVEVVDTDAFGGPAGYGKQSLRMSNAVTSGCFGDQTFSKSLDQEAGETTATNNGLSGGRRQSEFEAEWSFQSTVPDAEQPGLTVAVSPDRGDGARMSLIRMADTPAGIDIVFYDYQRGATVDPCGCCPPFVCTVVATGLDRSKSHRIRVKMEFVDGDSNDVVKVYVDGRLVHTGTSWEDYFRDEEDGLSRTVDSLLFRSAGAAAPGTLGAGFLIDRIKLRSSN